MIKLNDYSTLVGLGAADALNVAADSGLTIRAHADPTGDNAGDLGVEQAAEIAAVDPSLVYLTGTDTQAGVAAADLALLADAGMEHPVVLDGPTRWVTSYPEGDDSGTWGVTRDDSDPPGRWWLCASGDGSVDDAAGPFPLHRALALVQERNDAC